jgi:hypothetical protein
MVRSTTILTINRNAILAGLAIILAVNQSSLAQDNPHWNKNTCQVCHQETAPMAGAINLKAPDANALCETCHGDRGGAKQCRHISEISSTGYDVSEELISSLKDGQITCTTCHDLVFQCENPDPYYRYENAGFLRDRELQDTNEFCFKCHEPELGKLNPHGGIAGAPPRSTCLLCHASLPETDATGQLVVEFNMQHDLGDTCRGCHKVRPHPTNAFRATEADGWVHLVSPSAKILENMRDSKAETGIELPLSPVNGEVFCATCHNPHDFKLGGEHGSQSREVKHRLRQENICQACHEK